ncbi:hypothetical protein TIFTF001_028087 [Ficus carica]|uniref:Uncharacterized protein n=1 Tax=Ficus carica TaxID=3494 RepID=A0AA88J0P4_FICCA|nr:hypothetical protein TIFTF001_028087 [Ficus carica]
MVLCLSLSNTDLAPSFSPNHVDALPNHQLHSRIHSRLIIMSPAQQSKACEEISLPPFGGAKRNGSPHTTPAWRRSSEISSTR